MCSVPSVGAFPTPFWTQNPPRLDRCAKIFFFLPTTVGIGKINANSKIEVKCKQNQFPFRTFVVRKVWAAKKLATLTTTDMSCQTVEVQNGRSNFSTQKGKLSKLPTDLVAYIYALHFLGCQTQTKTKHTLFGRKQKTKPGNT